MADPRQLLQQLLQGQRGSPDLPSQNAQDALSASPTDGAIQAFIDRFGLARAQQPGGAPPGEIPMPRPRMPTSEPGIMGGMVPMPEGSMPMGTMRTSDVQNEVYGNPEETSDEEMLGHVRMGMGNEGGPPPGSGMKWEVLGDDQNALIQDPSPDNMQAFIQYWGEESLPDELTSGGGSVGGADTSYDGTGDVMHGRR